MSSSSASFSLDHLSPPPLSEQLCCVRCNFCDTALAVSVPCSSLYKTVTVRCGHCANLLSVNMRALLLAGANQFHIAHPFLSPAHQSLLGEMPYPPPSMLLDQPNMINLNSNNGAAAPVRGREDQELPHNPVVINRAPEKRQRVPSAYNRFIKDEIQRIKAGNPDITHREAFSAAAKNWAHFPHIHFGLVPHQSLKKPSVRPQQEGKDVLLKDGLYAAAAANMGISPF